MCGIAGVVAPGGAPPGVLERMANSIRHRGPDSDGFHRRANVALAIRRLAIIDLVTGDQPITSACTGATIVYNGELYNYRELRRELEGSGHRFTTRSDTEVVLHYYEEHGPNFATLNGIFAFAIDDPANGSVVLGRDHLGVKPLYYAKLQSGIAFASEPKALFASGMVGADVDRGGLATYLAHGHSSGTATIWRSIRKLAAGSVLIWDGTSEIRRYWDLLGAAKRWDATARPDVAAVEELLKDAVRRNMISDVPVGAFLSGGLDSSLVTALMRPHTQHLRTYSVGFGEGDDELPDALRVARHLGTQHTAITFTPEDAATTFGDLVRIYDEPFADAAALPTYAVAKRAREDVTVVLTGEGGDELFGGYRRYVAEQTAGLARLLPGVIRTGLVSMRVDRSTPLRRLGRVFRAVAEDERPVRHALWTETFAADERRALLGTDPVTDVYAAYRELAPSRADVSDDAVAMMAVELRTWLVDAYLEKVDKATMAASLEARVPLLDPRLCELLGLAPRSWKLRGGQTKVILRKIAARYVPAETIRKPKRGFGPPYDRWLRTTLAPRLAEAGESGAAIGDLCDIAHVRRELERFRRGEPRAAQAWALLMLDEWARNQRSATRDVDELPKTVAEAHERPPAELLADTVVRDQR